MPTYAYACKACHHEFDIYQDFSEEALTVCPECSAESLKKKFGSVGISFKGSGFYSTDSKSGRSTVTAGSGGSSSSSTTSQADSAATSTSTPSTSASSDSASSASAGSSSSTSGDSK